MEDEVHRAAEHLLLAMRPSHNKLIIMGCASRGKPYQGIAPHPFLIHELPEGIPRQGDGGPQAFASV